VTPVEAARVLAYFTAAWPWATVGEHTAEVWAEALAGVDPQDAHTAARRLAATEDRPPSIARFRAEAAKATRDRTPALRAPSEAVDPATATRVAAAVRAGLTVAAKAVPAHDHHQGAQSCPACTTRSERTHHAPEITDAITAELNRGRP